VIDQDIVEALEGFYHLNIMRNKALREQTLEVCSILNDIGIIPIWLKGATHLLTANWKISERTMLDLDFWIPEPNNQERALLALKKAGYFRAPEYDSDDPYGELHHHFAPLIKSGHFASLELHRHIVTERFRYLLPDNDALKNTCWSEWNGYRVGQLCAKDQALQAYIQCADMDSLFWLNPVYSSSLMKLLELQLRLSDIGPDNFLHDQLLPLTKLQDRTIADQIFTVLARDLNLQVMRATDFILLKVQEFKFTQLNLRITDFKADNRRFIYGLFMLRSAFRSLLSGSCGFPQHWPAKLAHHIKKMNDL